MRRRSFLSLLGLAPAAALQSTQAVPARPLADEFVVGAAGSALRPIQFGEVKNLSSLAIDVDTRPALDALASFKAELLSIQRLRHACGIPDAAVPGEQTFIDGDGI